MTGSVSGSFMALFAILGAVRHPRFTTTQFCTPFTHLRATSLVIEGDLTAQKSGQPSSGSGLLSSEDTEGSLVPNAGDHTVK